MLARLVHEDVLDLEVLDPEHEHVVEPLAGLGIERVRARRRWKQNILPATVVRRPPSSSSFVTSGSASASASRSFIVATAATLVRRGGVPERSNGEVLKTSDSSRGPWVQIPAPPLASLR